MDIVIWVLFLFQYRGKNIQVGALLILLQIILAFVIMFIGDRHFSETLISTIERLFLLNSFGIGVFLIKDIKDKLPENRQNSYLIALTLVSGALIFCPVPHAHFIDIQNYITHQFGYIGILLMLTGIFNLNGKHLEMSRPSSRFFILILPLIAFLPRTDFSILSFLGFIGLSIVNIDFITRRTAHRSLFNIKSIIEFIQSRMIFKFVSAFTLLIILAILGTSFSILTLTRNAIIQNEHKIFVRMAYSLKTEIENTIENNAQYLEQLKKNPNIDINNLMITGAFFYDAVRRNPSVKELMLLTPSHIRAVQSDINLINAESSPVTSLLYDLAIKNNLMIKNYISFQKDLMFVSIPILNPEETACIYSLAAFFNVNHLTALFEQLQKGTQLEIDIINSHYFSIQQHDYLSVTDALRGVSLKQNGFKKLSYQGEPYFVALMYDPKLDITYVVKQKESIALSGVLKGEQNALMILFGSTLLFIVLGLLLALLFENPIKVISAGLFEFKKGNLDFQIKLNNKDEMGQLAQSLNEMTSDLKTLFLIKAKSEQLALISTMAVTLNHEIKNPLASILMATNLIRKKLSPEDLEEIAPILDLLYANEKRIEGLINEISKTNEPIIEDYVEGTKMLKINFTSID